MLKKLLDARKKCKNFFDAFPVLLKTPPGFEFKNLDPKIIEQLRKIEKLEGKWVYCLTKADLLGQEFDEKAACFWSCTREMGRFLHLMILIIKPKLVLELGTSVGYSTLWMADACKKINSKIITIEYLEEKVKLAKNVFKRARVDKIVKIVHGDIRKVLENWISKQEKPQFVFMDANKEWQKYYLSLLEPMLPKEGLIVTDNVYDTYDIQKEFLREAFRSKTFISLFIPLDTHGALLSVKI